MIKNVIISIKGSQITEDDEQNIEFITEGKFYKKGEHYYITYKESEVTGMEGTTTTLKVADGVVTLMRFGAVNSQFVFQKQQRHVSYYETPYGTLSIGVFTHKMNVDIDDHGGEINVDYQLEMDHAASGKNDFYMRIRETGIPFTQEHQRPFEARN